MIDGHNLIPKLGLDLQDPDDETKLIILLQGFCQYKQTKVEVYFDGAMLGGTPQRKSGSVSIHFIRKGRSADAAIETRLLKLGRSARNWSVVSSDHRVQAAAHEVHARVISSEEFARQVVTAQVERSVQSKAESALSPAEVADWLELFNGEKKD